MINSIFTYIQTSCRDFFYKDVILPDGSKDWEFNMDEHLGYVIIVTVLVTSGIALGSLAADLMPKPPRDPRF